MAAALVPLQNITLGSAQSSVTFASIPATYRDLVLVCTGTIATATSYSIRLNSDTGSNYSYVYMYGDGSSAASGSATTTAALGGGIGTSTVSNSTFNIMDYSATDKHKTILNRTNNSTDATYAWANRWANTAAVTSVLVRGVNGANFSTGSTFALYGVVS